MVIIYLLLGYLLTDTSVLYTNSLGCNGTTQKCTQDNVTIVASPTSPQEGDNVNLTCRLNCDNTNVTFQWKKDGTIQPEENTSVFVINGATVNDDGNYVCSVNSSCFCCDSAPYKLTVNNNTVIILVICGISALVLVLTMGLIMKCKLKRDNEKHKERMRQRVQAGQAGGPFPYTPRET